MLFAYNWLTNYTVCFVKTLFNYLNWKRRGNKDTQLVMIQILRSHHISGWRRNQAVLGKPDFVFRPHPASPKSQRAGFRGVALFVDGCFWHGCPKHSNIPKNNQKFWRKKLDGNKDRDKFVTRELRKMGWRVVRVWDFVS